MYLKTKKIRRGDEEFPEFRSTSIDPRWLKVRINPVIEAGEISSGVVNPDIKSWTVSGLQSLGS